MGFEVQPIGLKVEGKPITGLQPQKLPQARWDHQLPL
jgi:hypothetical protein